MQNIDDEVALLNELKEIVLGFICEIERINFNDSSDIKLLFDKAKEVEDHLTKVDYIGKPSNIGCLVEVTKKLEKKVPYSIDYTQTEAYSDMPDREKQPAERYIDILPSRKLIDGIWQITPDYIKIVDSLFHKIIFFNPSIEPSEPVKPTKNSTLKLVDSLSKDIRNIEYRPIFHIDTKTCNLEYNELLIRSEEWFESKYQVFNKSNLEC